MRPFPTSSRRPGDVSVTLLLLSALMFTASMQLIGGGSAAADPPPATRLVLSGPAARQSTAPSGSTLAAGGLLHPGASLTAAGGRVVMTMQTDGNLVVRRDGVTSWATYTQGHPGAFAAMQGDGNFVVYSAAVKALWHTHTYGYAGAHATLQADTYFVVYSPVDAPLWWRDIGRGAALCNSTAADPRGTAITRWNPVTLCVLTVLRQSGGNLADVNLMVQYESSGDPTAINLWDSNAQQGHPSKGLIQVIQPTFDRFRSLQLSTDLFNPAANLYAGLNYAIYTYGSIHNVPGLVSLRNGGGYQGYITPS